MRKRKKKLTQPEAWDEVRNFWREEDPHGIYRQTHCIDARDNGMGWIRALCGPICKDFYYEVEK